MAPALQPAEKAPHAATPPQVHVALNSFELSALHVIAFDPEAAAAVRQGAMINVIDEDDSGVLRHIVALAAYPDIAWRAVAAAAPGLAGTADNLPLERVYSLRFVPPAEPVARFFRLGPIELAAGLQVDHPDAVRHRIALGARIHTLERLKGCDLQFFIEPDALSPSALIAVTHQMPRPRDGALWGPDMLLHHRVVHDDAVESRAWSLITELHAAIWVTHEAPFSAGLDFDAYIADMAARLGADPVAQRLLASDPDPDLDIVRDALAPSGGRALPTPADARHD